LYDIRVKFWRLSFIIFLIAAFPALAQACGCSVAAPGECPGLQSTDVAFMGTVTDAELVPPEPAERPAASDPAAPSPDAATPAATQSQPAAEPVPKEAPIYKYHFHIDERFAGPDQPEIDIFSGGDDGDCGYRFQKGQQYVVFTQEEADGHLYATICNGTRTVAEAVALIPQLRAMRDHRRVASVFGVLRRTDPPFLAAPDDPAEPMPVISLKLRSELDRFQANTDQDGVYTFYDVHAGTYNFTANLPEGTELTQKAQAEPLSAFSIPDGACYEYDVYALPIGEIRGTVLGPGGKPLPIASLELYREGSYSDSRPGYWGFQGATGAFEFDHVGPGQYILVYNRLNRRNPNSPFERTFYPGVSSVDQAKPIVLKKNGQVLQKINLKVTKGYPARTLRVLVKWTGSPPAGTLTVAARADKYENPSAERISDSLYTFTLLKDVNYTISAWEDLSPQTFARGKNACTMPARITAGDVIVGGSDDATKGVTLTLPKPACARQ
jgi:hypothetical protein